MFLKDKSSGADWIVAFLGNPGPRYSATRHNAGFMAADAFEKEASVKIGRLRFRALTALAPVGDAKVLLMKPQTYMNLSGEAVAPAVAYYGLPAERVIVVCDDVALPTGKLRIRTKGSSGGHNGLKSVIAALGTEEFPRIRIGVGAPPRNETEDDMINWVIGTFHGQDSDNVVEVCRKVPNAISVFIRDGADKAMNMFN